MVVEGAGCRETLQCPYHAWTYGLDGTLRKAPRSEREPGFDASAFSLLPVSVDTWGPFVFVNPDPDTGPLSDALGDVPEHVANSGVDLDRIRFHSHHEWTQEVNWKVALENYLECYHCPNSPPGLQQGDRRRPGLVPAQRGADVVEPARPGAEGSARGSRQGAV